VTGRKWESRSRAVEQDTSGKRKRKPVARGGDARSAFDPAEGNKIVLISTPSRRHVPAPDDTERFPDLLDVKKGGKEYRRGG